ALQRYAPAAAGPGATGSSTHPAHPEVRVFHYDGSQKGRENFWHFDVMPDRQPAYGALLRARVVPAVGGDTLFCDLAALSLGLPAALRRRLEDAVGIYDLVFPRQLARFRGVPEAEVMALHPDVPLEEVPLVLTRAVDDRRVLFVNPGFLVGIKDMPAYESRALLDDLRAREARPELQCRFRWQPGDIAFWDNRACLHYATNNYFPHRRTMERLTLTDEIYTCGARVLTWSRREGRA